MAITADRPAEARRSRWLRERQGPRRPVLELVLVLVLVLLVLVLVLVLPLMLGACSRSSETIERRGR